MDLEKFVNSHPHDLEAARKLAICYSSNRIHKYVYDDDARTRSPYDRQSMLLAQSVRYLAISAHGGHCEAMNSLGTPIYM
jgi:hypothetical protein